MLTEYVNMKGLFTDAKTHTLFVSTGNDHIARSLRSFSDYEFDLGSVPPELKGPTDGLKGGRSSKSMAKYIGTLDTSHAGLRFWPTEPSSRKPWASSKKRNRLQP